MGALMAAPRNLMRRRWRLWTPSLDWRRYFKQVAAVSNILIARMCPNVIAVVRA